MITHDVDEAIYLADRIVLMTNGPDAVLAEIVDNPLPKERARTDFHRHPLYYGVRNHIIDFLVTRSKNFADGDEGAALRPAPRAGGAAGRARADRRRRDDAAMRRTWRAARLSMLEQCHDSVCTTPLVGRRDQCTTDATERPRRTAMTRADLTEKILDIKREKGWSWKHICDQIGGMSPVLIVGALLGQMKLTKPQAAKAAELFGLSKAEAALLNEVPMRGARRADAADRSADLPLLRAGDGQRPGLEGADRGGVRRRHHVGDRLRHGDRAPARTRRATASRSPCRASSCRTSITAIPATCRSTATRRSEAFWPRVSSACRRVLRAPDVPSPAGRGRNGVNESWGEGADGFTGRPLTPLCVATLNALSPGGERANPARAHR